MLAIRRALYQPAPETVIDDDFYMTMKMIRSGRRVVFTPRARCYERISPTAQDEIARRSRMIAGRYQAIAMSPKTLPWNNPLAVWQVVSHKFMRPLVPFAMIGALLANLLALIWPQRAKRSAGGMLARLLHLTPPFNWILMALQLAFYTLAFLSGRQEKNAAGAWELCFTCRLWSTATWLLCRLAISCAASRAPLAAVVPGDYTAMINFCRSAIQIIACGIAGASTGDA
jgi:cellulose synthase/poly-beta-1,6-N-acetylglucosamine synthase-like glycosyltransferase